eukprot:403338312
MVRTKFNSLQKNRVMRISRIFDTTSFLEGEPSDQSDANENDISGSVTHQKIRKPNLLNMDDKMQMDKLLLPSTQALQLPKQNTGSAETSQQINQSNLNQNWRLSSNTPHFGNEQLQNPKLLRKQISQEIGNRKKKEQKFRQNTPQIKLQKQDSNMQLPNLVNKSSKISSNNKKRNLNHSKSMLNQYEGDIDNLYHPGDDNRDNSKNLYEDSDEENYKSSSRKPSTQMNERDVTIPSKPSNEAYTELVKTFQRARLDSLLGLSHNFFNQNEPSSSEKVPSVNGVAAAAAVIGNQFGQDGQYKIFDLGNKQFKDCTLNDILNFNHILKKNMKRPSLLFDTESAYNLFSQLNLSRYPSAVQANYSHYMIMMTNINEEILTSILKSYNLNPILLWEIILKQQYDKVFRIDDNTVFYNIEIIEEDQLQKKFVVKIVHLINKHIMLVITSQAGHLPMMNLMSKIFKFQSLDEYFAQLLDKAKHQEKRMTIAKMSSLDKKSHTNTDPSNSSPFNKSSIPPMINITQTDKTESIKKDNQSPYKYINSPKDLGFAEQVKITRGSSKKIVDFHPISQSQNEDIKIQARQLQRHIEVCSTRIVTPRGRGFNDFKVSFIDMQEIKLQIKDYDKADKLSNLRTAVPTPLMGSANLTNQNDNVISLDNIARQNKTFDQREKADGNSSSNLNSKQQIMSIVKDYRRVSIAKHVRIDTDKNTEMEATRIIGRQKQTAQQQQPNIDSEAYTHSSQTSESESSSEKSESQQSESEYDDEDEDECSSSASQLVDRVGKFRKSQKQLGPNRFNNHGEQGKILCEDILYGIFDESMRKIEPIIVRFEREAQALNNLSLNLSHYEKLGYVRRSHMAKDVMLHFESDLEIKHKFLKSLMKKDFTSTKMKLLLKFLRGRLYNSRIIMKRAQGMICLSDQTYENMVDNGLNEHSNQLNVVMKGLAAITVVVLPFNVVSGFMGMNVTVPFADEETIIPFFVLFSVSAVFAVLFYFGLRKINWM